MAKPMDGSLDPCSPLRGRDLAPQRATFDLANPDSASVQLDVAGDTEIQSRDKLGFEWDPVSGRAVAWDSGADVYVLEPPEGDWKTGVWTWTRFAPHASNSVVPERQTGTWLMGSPERQLLFEDPQTDAERLELARRCEREMALGFPFLVDRIDDAVNTAYAAWPERLYLVDVDGTVVYKGGKGPQEFRPEELGAVLEEVSAFYGE